MRLWSIQPLAVWEIIQRDGVFQCDPAQCSMPDLPFLRVYRWLAREMEKRIGPPPEGVVFPVWAWYSQNGKHAKPDLRSERWGYGPGDEDYTCIELEVPDDQVLLSDFDTWHIVLNNGLISDSEEEDNAQDAYYETLPHEQQRAYQEKNWERVFDVSPRHDSWMTRGDWIQATFWELRKEYVRHVRFFRTAHQKEQPHYVFHTATALRFGEGTALQVTFDDGCVKTYDVAPLFEKYPFMRALENRALFLSGKLSPGGYGIIWTDDIDLDIEAVYQDGTEGPAPSMPKE